MKKIRFLTLFLFTSLICACASIPPESIDLSHEIGIGLKKQYQSQIDLINLHFSIKRERLDAAMEKALNNYFESLTPSGTIELTPDQLRDVTNDVIYFNANNNKAKEALEKARVLLIKKLNENYLTLNLANASINGLLQSSVTVKEARSDAFQSLFKATDKKIALDKVFRINRCC